MKKKFLRLIEAGKFQDQSDFVPLFATWRDAEEAYALARQEKLKAREAYKNLFTAGKPDEAGLVQHLSHFRKAKLMQQYRKEECKWADYVLSKWVEQHLSEAKGAKTVKLVQGKPGQKATPVKVRTT